MLLGLLRAVFTYVTRICCTGFVCLGAPLALQTFVCMVQTLETHTQKNDLLPVNHSLPRALYSGG